MRNTAIGATAAVAGTGTPTPAAAPHVPRYIRLAAHAAALTLVPSGLWRIAIAFGWDSGFTEESLGPENFPGTGSFYLIGLSLLAEALGLLTLGLVHRWGEELPYWVPVLGGRSIPVMAAVIPASLGAVLVTFITVTGAFTWNDADNMGAAESPDGFHNWLMTACYLPLLAWGPLLAVVTAAYYRRRRPGRGR
ncbi:hypothetical protein ACIQPT_21055 [Streptomyces sp. NPDC091289]|uniref:hypothetical protein n=1 Tax=Streptomyces sp. NPDC091289 TaxID=3365989 RepID=UPI0038157060